MSLLNVAVVALSSFSLFLWLCLLVITLREKKGNDPMSLAWQSLSPLIKSWTIFLAKPISQNKSPDNNYEQVNRNQYPSSPRVFLKPTKGKTQNDSSRYNNNDNNSRWYSGRVRHVFELFPNFCIRVYRLFSRSQPKGNDTF